MPDSNNIPFQSIDWNLIPKSKHTGKSGTAKWQTVQFEGLRIRLVEYSPGYIADHWCEKGLSSHRSVSEAGVKLMIIDGDFLRFK